MSAGWIFFKDPTTGEESELELDVVLAENPSGEAAVTDHPVEEGADISDHIRAKPRGVTIEAVISNTPMALSPAPQMEYRDKASPPRFELLSTVPYEDRAGWADKTLERIRTEGMICRVVTRRREYSDVALTSYSPPVDRTTGDALRFSATFRRIIKVSTRLLETKQKPVPEARKERGSQPTKKAEAPVEKRVSLLRQAWRLGGGK